MGFPSPGRRGAAEASAGGEGKTDEDVGDQMSCFVKEKGLI